MEVQRGEWFSKLAFTVITHQITQHPREKIVCYHRSFFLGVHFPMETIGALMRELWSGEK